MAEETEEMRRVGLELTGRVQGVGFRWWTARTAEALGLCGTVRNRSDGAVEIHLAGPGERVEEMRSRLEDGPGPARVDEVREIESGGSLPERFEILR